VAELGPVHLTGFAAWVTWAVAHIFFLIGFRNRVLVSAQWLIAYLSHERGGRVIVQQAGEIGPARRGT
jgi:NADH dehydrogenase